MNASIAGCASPNARSRRSCRTATQAEKWVELNRQYAGSWPVITRKGPAPADADSFKDVPDKFEKFFGPNPGKR